MRRFLISISLLTMFVISAAGQQSTAGENYSKANTLVAEGSFTKAAVLYELALEQASHSDRSAGRELRADILMGLGITRYNLKEFEAAESLLEKSASVRKAKHSDTFRYLALVQLGLDKTPEATRYLNIAIAADSENAEAWFELGRLLMKQGSNARAKVAFETAIEFGTKRMDEARSSLASL